MKNHQHNESFLVELLEVVLLSFLDSRLYQHPILVTLLLVDHSRYFMVTFMWERALHQHVSIILILVSLKYSILM